MIPLAIGLLFYSLYHNNAEMAYYSLSLGGLVIISNTLQWLLAEKAKCPLCMAYVLRNNGSSKHKHAGKFLGSHRGKVALDVLFLGEFTCPSCAERSKMEVRRPHYG